MGRCPNISVSISDQNLCFTTTFAFIVVVWNRTHSNLQGLPVSVYPMEEDKDFLAFQLSSDSDGFYPSEWQDRLFVWS